MSKGAETRQTILDHAAREAARLGLRGLSIGTLAGDLGMSKSGLFAHFDSKEALEAEIIDHVAEVFTDRVIRPALRTPRGEPRVRALIDGWLAWFESEGARGCVFVAASTELDDQPSRARDRLVAQQRDWLDFLASVARVAIAEGHFRVDLDPEQLAHDINGVMLGYHHARRLLADPRGGERARRAIEALLAAARRPPVAVSPPTN